MTRKRLFTEEFEKGNEVYIIRSKHGWFDGERTGKIIRMGPDFAVVREDDGSEHEIEHPRDLRRK